MGDYLQWQIDSEAASRFWNAVIAIEGIIKWVKVWPALYRKWRLESWIIEPPPICHAGYCHD